MFLAGLLLHLDMATQAIHIALAPTEHTGSMVADIFLFMVAGSGVHPATDGILGIAIPAVGGTHPTHATDPIVTMVTSAGEVVEMDGTAGGINSALGD
jgi:hypothetical protein